MGLTGTCVHEQDSQEIDIRALSEDHHRISCKRVYSIDRRGRRGGEGAEEPDLLVRTTYGALDLTTVAFSSSTPLPLITPACRTYVGIEMYLSKIKTIKKTLQIEE